MYAPAHNRLPSGRIALQVFALPFEHTGPDLSSGWVVLARVLDIFESAQWHVWVDKVRVTSHESTPFVVPRHCNRSSAQLFDSVVHFICITLQDASEGIVCFLDFADDNRFKLTAGVLQI